MYQLDGGAPFRRDSTGAVFDSAGKSHVPLGVGVGDFLAIARHCSQRVRAQQCWVLTHAGC